MLPWWLEGSLALRWFAGGEWHPVPLAGRGPSFGGTAPDGGGIEVAVSGADPAEWGCRDLRVLSAEIRPNARGEVWAAQLVMPLDPSLRCVWQPHLAPAEGMAIGDRVFRSPAIILESPAALAAVVPDLAHLGSHRTIPHVMDYRLDGHAVVYGLSDYVEDGHVYHRVQPQRHRVDGPLRFRLYLPAWDREPGAPPRDFRPVEAFLRHRLAPGAMGPGGRAPGLESLEPYVRHAYGWAFDRWRPVCWQEFELGGRPVGGVVFVVTARQKPGLGQEDAWREPRSLWNQAWFSGLRSAYGYWLWGRHWGRDDLVAKAEKALELALSAPNPSGFFPACFQAGPDQRWESGGWVMSGRHRPPGHDGYVHLLDSSWTGYWLLKWYRDVVQDPRIVPYVRRYVERLLALQRPDGGFPAWVRPTGGEHSPYLAESPETSAHAMLLCLLHELRPDARYLESAGRAMQHVVDRILPTGRWEDFETYWSCARQWAGRQYGRPDPRSGLYNQSTFGMYLTAEALKDLYRSTGKTAYLDAGERVLAELSLYQQIWDPPFLPVPALGGFGVMNSDDEWNDARQSLFALTYLDYHRLTGREAYRLRGLWAMRAAFYMMYCPESPRARQIYEAVYPHFDEFDFGFHMENFHHHDGTDVGGLGEFTIFDWGCGAAAASLAELLLRRQGGSGPPHAPESPDQSGG